MLFARPLSGVEKLHYRDKLRAARYAALADGEGFAEVCFAIEAFGVRLLGSKGTLNDYRMPIRHCAALSVSYSGLHEDFPYLFRSFDALFRIVQTARNDAMHTGAYARHATQAAIELCIYLEEALMTDVEQSVGDLMVKNVVAVEAWHPIAQARQLMLTHSFSFLPVRLENEWWLMSELGVARYLAVSAADKRRRLGQSISEARASGLELMNVPADHLLRSEMRINQVLASNDNPGRPTLWLVVDAARPDQLAGVLTPFEVM